MAKSYSDTYLYNMYPMYTKKITDAIMKDPIIDKSTDQFKDVVHEIKRARVSDNLVKILNSTNVLLLDCANPMDRSFKVFCARDMKSKDRALRIFIDCTGVIEKRKNSSDMRVDETKLIAYLINAATTMVYHRSTDTILRRNDLVTGSVRCFANLFTQVIDYLAKISIQESSKIKCLYLASMYFGIGVLQLGEDRAKDIAKYIAGISDREATILDVFMEKNSVPKGGDKKEYSPYENIKVFIGALRESLHLDRKVITTDMVVERWMRSYGPGTVFALEYFPHLSAMITDAYIGGYINQQKAIEKVCGTDMVSYAKKVISMIDNIA